MTQELARDATLDELDTMRTILRTQIKSLETRKRTIVSENYHSFITAASQLRLV